MSEQTKEEWIKKIESVLDTLREGLASHSGDVELVDVDLETGKVSVRLKGACVGCPMADLTLKACVGETLMQLIPEISEVVGVE